MDGECHKEVFWALFCLLFIFYINDTLKLLKNLFVYLFVDDLIPYKIFDKIGR